MTDVTKQLARAIDALRPEAREHADALARYVGLVETWNKKIDLTAVKTAGAMIDVLVADSLVMARTDLVPEGAHLLDVGAGAGAPAIPLAIVRPDIRVTMLEPIGKRIAFLRTVIGTLGLAPRVSARDGRIDPSAPAIDGDFTITSARATFAPEEWLRIGRVIAPSVLVLTTGDAPEGATPSAQQTYRQPGAGAPRAIFKFDRESGGHSAA